MKSKLLAMSVLLCVAFQANAGIGRLTFAKVQGFQNGKYKLLTPKYQMIVDSTKISRADNQLLHSATPNQPVHLLIPNSAIVSMNKIKTGVRK